MFRFLFNLRRDALIPSYLWSKDIQNMSSYVSPPLVRRVEPTNSSRVKRLSSRDTHMDSTSNIRARSLSFSNSRQKSSSLPSIHGFVNEELQPQDIDMELQSVVEEFNGPIKQLTKIFQNLVDYRIDAEFAANQAPKLASQLKSNTSVDKLLHTMAEIHKLARNQASCYGLVTCKELVHEIIMLLQTTENDKLQSISALALQLITKTECGANMVNEGLGIPTLVKMLKHPSENVCHAALFMINQLLWLFPNKLRPEFRSCSGHINLVHLFDENRVLDPYWLLLCIDTLRMATYESSVTKLSLTSTNLCHHIVRRLHTYANNTKIAYNIARLLKVLSVCNQNKAQLVEAGAVDSLALLLNSSNEVLQLEALWGLRNISDQAYHISSTNNLIPTLITLVGSKNEHISICTVGCLCNLTCQNSTNKSLFVEKGGVKALCQLLIQNPHRQEIVEPVCSALRHVTHRNLYANSAIYEIRMNNTIPTIASLATSYPSLRFLPLIKTVVGLIRNIATEDESREQLRDHDVTTSLVHVFQQILIATNSESDKRNLLTIGMPESVVYMENVYFEDTLEIVLAAMQILAKDQTAQDQLLHAAGLLTGVVQLLYTTSTCLQRATTALLSQLSNSRAGCLAIEREGACSRLTELIQSSNEYIAAYSAAVLHRIAQDKPEEYRKRLSLELRQSLFDGGILNDTQVSESQQLKQHDRMLKSKSRNISDSNSVEVPADHTLS